MTKPNVDKLLKDILKTPKEATDYGISKEDYKKYIEKLKQEFTFVTDAYNEFYKSIEDISFADQLQTSRISIAVALTHIGAIIGCDEIYNDSEDLVNAFHEQLELIQQYKLLKEGEDV